MGLLGLRRESFWRRSEVGVGDWGFGGEMVMLDMAEIE